MSTRAAPARFRTRAQASAVAPVVITSSTALAAKLPARSGHPEGSGDVLPPLRRSEPDLGVRALDPREQETVDRHACQGADGLSQHGWLKRRDQSRDR